MKYGESLFDILYILFSISLGTIVLLKSNNKKEKLMGYSTLLLGFGDAFHLIPRVLNYFINSDFNIYLGTGKLITSITISFFYIFIYYIYLINYKIKEKKQISIVLWVLLLIRIILCLFPQNGWFTNESPFIWGIIRNIPFAIMGIIIAYLFYKRRNEDIIFKRTWLYITLSFLFYFIVVIFSSFIPMLGMFMLPKTICYILIIVSFRKKQIIENNERK